MDRQKIERSIKGLSEWQMHVQTNSDIDRDISTAIEALKAQLSLGGTTKDAISKTETVEHLRRVLEATVPNTDYDEGYIDGIEFGVSTVSTMPTIQPQSTAGQLNDSAQSTNLIDRRETIDRFNVIRPVDPKKDEYTKGIDVGIAMCIVAVKDQPTIQPVATDTNVGDTISRQSALEKVRTMQAYKLFEDIILVDKAAVQTELMMLPSVQPEPQEGHWIEGKIYRDVIECNCSECGQLMTTAASVRMSYCPNCGADMRGEQDEH